MKAEDKVLQQYIDKHRLIDWVSQTFKTAQEEIRVLVDEATSRATDLLEP